MSTITAILTPSPDGTLHLPLPEHLRSGRIRVVATLDVQDKAMIPEHAVVRLLHDRSADGLKAGESGTVVHVYAGGEGYEVEFIGGRSRPRLVTVEPEEIELAEGD